MIDLLLLSVLKIFIVVTSQEYTHIVKEQLPDLPEANILGEPSRKNTAPCIAYISFKLQRSDPKASLIVAPADHLILDNKAFTKVCLEALSFVNKHNAFITLGITPLKPNTGYGYIQREQHTVTDNVYKVKTFTEKPNLELAKTFLPSGDFLWNAGIFVWQVKNIIQAFEKYLPEMYDVFHGREGCIQYACRERSAGTYLSALHEYFDRLWHHGKSR